MADYPRKGSTDRTVRSHGEQIRRIRTRIPIGGEAITYQITNADLRNDTGAGTGWYVEGFPFPSLVRQGDMVMLNGMFLWVPGLTPVDPIIPAAALPDVFHPFKQTRIHAAGNGFSTDRIWVLLLEPDGQLGLSTTSVTSHPDNVWGDATDGDQHVISITTCYPAASLGLGDIPA